jgi:serine/threonine protein kinase/tetratricopeptide (TPR) repeat protein
MTEASEVLAGRYRLRQEIGRGGLGSVWQATDESTGREVAIKRLRSEYGADPRLRRRMRREARAVGRLEHPNIVRLFEIGEDDRGPFLVMEWVRGRPLSKVRPDGHRLISLLDQMLAALAYAHARGVVHRDLKPQNVLVTEVAPRPDRPMRPKPDGSQEEPRTLRLDDGSVDEATTLPPAGGPTRTLRAKLLDFGFAWVENDLDQEISLAARDVFGTPHYMAPEQAMREDNVGPSADLYAVGIIAWELCCGAPPFDGNTGADVLIQHVNQPLPPFTPRAELILPHGLDTWLARALAKEPADRFASAGEMRRALLALETGVAPTIDRVELADATEVVALTESLDGTLTPPRPAGLLASAEGPLVGREPLMRWLWGHVAATFNSPAPFQVVMLEGDPGLGRTRLCAWLTRTVAEGGWMTVAAGRHQQGVQSGLRAALRAALGLERRPPQRPEVLAQALAVAGAADLDAALVARCLWPEIGPCPPSRARRVVERLVRRLAARRPVLICLDDLHRAWGEDLDLVEHLLFSLSQRPAPVLVVLTRPALPVMGQPTAGEARVAVFLKRRQELVEVRRVGRLSDDDVRTLIQQALPVTPAVASHLARAARGNPLVALAGLTWLLEQRALAAVAEGPHDFVSIPPALPPQPLGLMIERLDVALARHRDGALLRTLAWHLALLGDAFPFGLARELGDALQLPESRLINALDALVRLAVLEDRDGDSFAFRNAITRDALLQMVAQGPEPGALHRPVAIAKAAWYADRAGLAAAEIARHHLAADDVENAVRFQVLAADHARRSQQPKVAVALLAEADRWLTIEASPGHGAPRVDVLLRLAEVVLSQGDATRALRVADRVSEWAAARSDAERVRAAELVRGEALAALGQLVEAEAVLEPLAREAEERIREQSREPAPGERPDRNEVTRVALIRGRIAVRRGDLKVGRRLFQLAASSAASAGDRQGEAAGQQALGELALKAGEREQAVEALQLAAEICRSGEDEALRAAIHLRLGELERKAGHLEAALPHFRTAAEAFEAANNHSGVGRSLRGLGDAQWALGLPEAARTYAAAVDTFALLDDDFQLGICLTQLGRIALENGNPTEADTTLERAAALLEPLGDASRLGLLLAFRAQAAHRLGRAATRDLHLEAALQIDAQHPLLFAEWADVLEELAPALEAGPTLRLTRRAAAVRAALSH